MTKRRKKRVSTSAPRRAARRRSRASPASDAKKQNAAALARELAEAQEQQAATAEVLRVIAVPMRQDDQCIRVIAIYRQEVRPITDNPIELVTAFARQAVIAIENVRLLNELRQRTDDLSESLEQQTATSEVLRVISSSPGDLEPVFQTMLEKATRICEANFGYLQLYREGAYRIVAM